jgi:hypothetical protein
MAEGALAGRVFVLLDDGTAADGAEVAHGLAEAGASIVTVHEEGRPPDGRAVFAGSPANPFDVDAARAMAAELFGPVDAVVDLADLPSAVRRHRRAAPPLRRIGVYWAAGRAMLSRGRWHSGPSPIRPVGLRTNPPIASFPRLGTVIPLSCAESGPIPQRGRGKA